MFHGIRSLGSWEFMHYVISCIPDPSWYFNRTVPGLFSQVIPVTRECSFRLDVFPDTLNLKFLHDKPVFHSSIG